MGGCCSCLQANNKVSQEEEAEFKNVESNNFVLKNTDLRQMILLIETFKTPVFETVDITNAIIKEFMTKLDNKDLNEMKTNMLFFFTYLTPRGRKRDAQKMA